MTDLDHLTSAERTRETDALYEQRERDQRRGHPHCIEYGCEMRPGRSARWQECYWCGAQRVVPALVEGAAPSGEEAPPPKPEEEATP